MADSTLWQQATNASLFLLLCKKQIDLLPTSSSAVCDGSVSAVCVFAMVS
jgi:hypothetical protein